MSPGRRATTYEVRDPFVIRGEGALDVVGTLRDAGRPSAVVLVHGIVGSRRLAEVDAVATALAERHDTLAIDVLGHGDSPGRFTWGREEWRQVTTAVRHLKADGRRVSVVGFSFGGYHAVRAAARGAPVDRLVLVGAPVDRNVLDRFPFGRGFWRHVPAMSRRKRRASRFEWPYWPRATLLRDDEIGAVPCPTLVIHGTDDWLVSRRHAERYLAMLPNARLLEIRGGFHAEYLMSSHPAELLAAIDGFLAG